MAKALMGRPTKYSEKMVAKAKEYLAKLPDDEAIHSIEGLADYLDITRSTLYDWISQENKTDFSDIVQRILQMQAKSLMTGGIRGTFNASITKVLLTKHGYREGKDITSDDKPLPAVNVLFEDDDD